jgi:hypothetical protein
METAQPEDADIDPEMLALIRWQEENPDVWGDQDENGVDLARLRENLKLTPAERLRKHGIALLFALQVEQAGERYRQTHAGGPRIS